MQQLVRRGLAAGKSVAAQQSVSCTAPHVARQHRVQQHQNRQFVSAAAQGTKLSDKRCEPCEASHDAMDKMGLAMIMDQETAEKYHSEVDPRWQLVRDSENRLRMKRQLRTKNFVKALALFEQVGQVAEEEKHHPDLHLEGWNNVTIELWTHARDGLSENDFIVAAKLDELLATRPVLELLSKKQPEL